MQPKISEVWLTDRGMKYIASINLAAGIVVLMDESDSTQEVLKLEDVTFIEKIIDAP